MSDEKEDKEKAAQQKSDQQANIQPQALDNVISDITKKDGVSADVTALAQEIFSLFDKDGDGYLLKQDALAALRSVGLNPEEKEVDHMLRVFVPIGESGLDFRTFMVMMSKVSRVGDCEEDMEEAFRVFDKGSSGVMTVADFRHILTTMGEKVSDEDMDDMLQYVTYNDRGDIKYRDFIKAMFSDGSTLPPIEMK